MLCSYLKKRERERGKDSVWTYQYMDFNCVYKQRQETHLWKKLSSQTFLIPVTFTLLRLMYLTLSSSNPHWLSSAGGVKVTPTKLWDDNYTLQLLSSFSCERTMSLDWSSLAKLSSEPQSTWNIYVAPCHNICHCLSCFNKNAFLKDTNILVQN